MNRPELVIMAAGVGSRYGGLKQIDPVSGEGEMILDFSLYDAMLSGFEKVILVIKEENEKDFRRLMDNGAGKYLRIEYALQKLRDLPEGYRAPSGRRKPWGTAHAILSAGKYIDGPFAVINADDYYGPGAFQSVYDYLSKAEDRDRYDYAMVGYLIDNTLTENGHVSRGICGVSEEGLLTGITERTQIMKRNGRIVYTEDDGKTWIAIREGTTVSMNFWGFTQSLIAEAKGRFPLFLDKALKEDPLKSEYLLPEVVDQLIKEGKARVRVLRSRDRWYGVTYRKDRQSVVDALQSMKDKGLYPEKLWI